MHTITAHQPMLNDEAATGDALAGKTLSATVSAAMDGELYGSALTQLIRACKPHSRAEDDWRSYHIIGDALRQTSVSSTELSERIRLLVADEPTVLAPQRKRSISKFIMPVAASVAAICLVSWSALNIPSSSTHTAVMAAMPLQIAKLDPSRLNNFIAAHRDFSPGASSPFMDADYQVPARPAR